MPGSRWPRSLIYLVVVGLAETAAAQVLPDPVYLVRMEARYAPETRRIEGVERLRWRNTASVPVDELQFHLYLNAFANDQSTFMAESGGQLRSQRKSEDVWGWIEVGAMRLAYGDELDPEGSFREVPPAGEGWQTPTWEELPPTRMPVRPDLKAVEEFIQPDDGNLEDRTVTRYPLPRPLAPGEWLELEIEFQASLPDPFARSGAHGEYVLAAQWFPKVGVFEDRGVRGRAEPGWNTHQYHAHSEFYADFGDWDVTLSLPARYHGRVGATGQLV